ncbi:MAG: hypothetical protein M1834_008487 [Cirrosporium novae-zelandiae]|nr:MAG: hypothetical protein M1834_008487 [Cirrosporium novae-zelandiae]
MADPAYPISPQSTVSASNIPSSQPVAAVGATASRTRKSHACASCQRRKVKCDREWPCSTCVKTNVECIFRALATPNRRKRSPQEVNLRAQIRQYEELLRNLGVRIDVVGSKVADPDKAELLGGPFVPSSQAPESPKEKPQGQSKAEYISSPGLKSDKLIVGRGWSRYVTSNLWKALSDEVGLHLPEHLPDSKEILEDTQSDTEEAYTPIQEPSHMALPYGEDLILNPWPEFRSLRALHPQPILIFRLWQTYLDNVDPLTKLFHSSSVQQEILKACDDLHNLSKGMEALMFAIYLSAISSLSSQDCESMIGDKSVLVAKYRFATKQALNNASFLRSSDLTTLQAFVLYLLSMRGYYDPGSLWILTGTAVRIGRRTGIHRDGASFGLSIFETEMRRRLWWQIISLDNIAGQLSGTGTPVSPRSWDTKPPLNVNDSELNSEMTKVFVNDTGLTEMVFVLLRCELAQYFGRRYTCAFVSEHDLKKQTNDVMSITIKDKSVDDLENMLEQKFVRHCDPSVPLHLLCIIMAKIAVCLLRLLAHNPRQYRDKKVPMPNEERDIVFSTCLKIFEYENLVRSTKSVQRFSWFFNAQFQYYALIYLLSELHHRTSGPDVDRAWQLINDIFERHPLVKAETNNPLNVAMGNLTLKAWEAWEAELLRHSPNPSELTIPDFILTLYSQRKPTTSRTREVLTAWLMANPTSEGTTTPPEGKQKISANCTERSRDDLNPSVGYTFPEVGPGQIDWAEWDTLLQDFPMHMVE